MHYRLDNKEKMRKTLEHWMLRFASDPGFRQLDRGFALFQTSTFYSILAAY